MTGASTPLPALELIQLAKAYGNTPILADVSLRVMPGELTAVLGSSGSGKTTLLRLIAGLETADGGTIKMDEEVVDSKETFTPPERRKVGYVPQEGALFPQLTVANNIGFALPRTRLRRHTAEAKARIGELIALVGLENLDERLPHQLSGGERQRVALARALAPGPHLVLLDEPFSSLDAELRVTVRHEIAMVLRRANATAILVTHDQDEALSTADRVALLQHGTIVQHDTPANLYHLPATPAVARFIGRGNLLEATLVDGHARCVLGHVPVDLDRPAPEGSPLTILIRPEQIDLDPARDGNGPGTAEGIVTGTEFRGNDTLVTLQLTASRHSRESESLVASVPGRQAPVVAQQVSVRVNERVFAWTQFLDEGRASPG